MQTHIISYQEATSVIFHDGIKPPSLVDIEVVMMTTYSYTCYR